MNAKRFLAACGLALAVLGLTACSREPSAVQAPQAQTPQAQAPQAQTPQAQTPQAAQTEYIRAVPEAYFAPAAQAGQVVEISYGSRDYTDASEPAIQKTAYVYLPYGYDEADLETRYDVLYLMHGWTMTAGGFLDTAQSFSRSVEELSVFHRDLRENLIPFVESRYHTYAQDVTEAGLRASRAHRAFGGFSLGAVTTWYQFLYNLDCIRYFFPMSGDCWIMGTYGGLNHPVETVDRLEQAVSDGGWSRDDFSISQGIGTQDPIWDQTDSQIQEMLGRELFDAEPLHYAILEGGRHDLDACARYLYHALQRFFGGDAS